MKTLDQIQMTLNQREALREPGRSLPAELGVEVLRLFGSITRGESDDESDLDVLVITKSPLDRSSSNRISEITFEINLRYVTNISALVVDHASWDDGPYSILPTHDEIHNEGISFATG